MNADLERELREFPEFGPVVARLRASRQVDVGSRAPFVQCVVSSARISRPFAFLLAAAVLVVVSFAIWFAPSPGSVPLASRVTYGGREYRLSTEEMVASQNADGSWQNDFLTRRNAEALRGCGTAAAQTAYKKALRNLRVRGLVL